MKRKDITYKNFQRYVKDKDVAVVSYIENTLAKTQAMFTYSGLPETIPAEELERLLQCDGTCLVAKVDKDLYALQGSAGGVGDVYNRPTLYTVANVALKLNKTFRIGVDGVLVKNDTNGNSLLPIIGKYATLLTDGVISLNTASIMTRATMLITASDDRTKQSADEFMKRIMDGDFSVIGENAFFKGISVHSTGTANTAYINQLVELVQYYKASMLNELGLNANYNMKRERLNLGEVSMNVDALLPYVDNMLHCRLRALREINEMFNTEITVSLNSSWQLEKENLDTLTEDVTVETEQEQRESTVSDDGAFTSTFLRGTDADADASAGTDGESRGTVSTEGQNNLKMAEQETQTVETEVGTVSPTFEDEQAKEPDENTEQDTDEPKDEPQDNDTDEDTDEDKKEKEQ